MADTEQKHGLIRELTRRKVFRSAAAYTVVAWLIVQVASIVFPEFGAPAWAMRALIIVFVAGFPPAMILAWTVDLSSSGFTRTAESGYSRARGTGARLAVFAVASLLSVGILWLTWSDYVVQPGKTVARPAVREQAVIAVNTPRKLAGRAESDWLGDGIANLIRSELADSRHAIVLSQSRWQSLIDGVDAPADISRRANDVGVDYLIDGEYLDTPDGIVLTLHIEDLKNGIEIHSSRSTAANAAGIIGNVPELSLRIKQALRIPHRESVGLFEADFAVEHLDAYEAYIAGLAFLVDFNFAAAEESFKAALVVAPDYHIARFRLAQVYEATGRSALALKNLEEISLEGPISERERLYIEGAKAYFVEKRDAGMAIEIYKRLVELYPFETEAGMLLAEAYWLDFQDDAAIQEFRRLSELHPYDPLSWVALGERLLDVGDLAGAKIALERYAAMQPQEGYAFALLGNLAALQGDIELSVEHQQHALELRPGFAVAQLGLARSKYLVGEWGIAIELWRLLVADQEAAAGFRIDAAFDLAGVLQGRGLFADSMQAITSVMPLIREESLRTSLALATLGMAEFERGNTETAATLIDEAIAGSPGPATRYLFARGLIELRTNRLGAAVDTIAEIEAIALLATDPDLNETKAARFLAGLLALQRDDPQGADERLLSAVDLEGYQYAVYKLGLALLRRSEGNLEAAAQLAANAATERDPGNLRLDLELDRTRARLLHAEILSELGRRNEARALAQTFVDLWRAGENSPEATRANAILVAQ